MSQLIFFEKEEAPIAAILTLTGDSLGPVFPDGAGNIDVLGGAGANNAINILTRGNLLANTLDVRLTDSILLPQTNAAGTQGVIALGSTSYTTDSFIHSLGFDNTFIGHNAGNFTFNTALAQGNTIVGSQSLIALTQGNYNTGMGFQSFNKLTTSVENCAYGVLALENLETGNGSNVAIGMRSLENLETGTNNTCIGHSSGLSLVLGNSSNVLVASTGQTGDNNTIRIGTQGSSAGQQNRCFVAGIVGVTVSNTQLVTINSSTGQLGVTTPFSWSIISVNLTATTNKGYLCNKGGILSLTLPTTSAVGDILEVYNMNVANGIQFVQAASQRIFIGNTSTTLGAGGTLSSTAVGDSLKMVCSSANLVWRVVSMVGNWTPA